MSGRSKATGPSKRLDRRAARRQETRAEIIGADFGLRPVIDLVRRVAPSDSPVLLLGETGVGKDVIAHAIHASSTRRDGPFITVDCSTLAENLFESGGAHGLRSRRGIASSGGMPSDEPVEPQTAEIELAYLEIGVWELGANLVGARPTLGFVAAGERHRCALLGELFGGDETDAGVGAGDDHAAAVEILVEDFGGAHEGLGHAADLAARGVGSMCPGDR